MTGDSAPLPVAPPSPVRPSPESPALGPAVESPGRPTLDLLGAAALWGGMYVVSSATFAAIPPITLAALRILIGTAALGIAFRGRLGFRRALLPRVVGAGLIVGLTMVLQFVGTDLTGAADGALLTTTTPAFVLLFGVWLEGQHVGRRAWLGVAISLAGVAVLAARNGSFGAGAGVAAGAAAAVGSPSILGVPSPLVGDLLLVGSAATWALFSSVGRPLVREVGAFRAISQSSCVAVIVLLPLAAIELAGHPLPALDGSAVAAVLYLGVMSTAVAWSLWYRGYAGAPATLAAAAFFAQPIVGAGLGVLLLGEAIGPAFLVGAALIGSGVLAIAFDDRRPGTVEG